MSPILPAALAAGVTEHIARFAPAELARRSAALSKTYRAEGSPARAIADEADIAAYLAQRMPATYAAMAAALAEVVAAAPAFAPKTILDAGAGPGTASWAATEAWPDVRSALVLEPNPKFLSAAKALAANGAHPALREAHFIQGDATAIDAAHTFDLVLAGYVVAEIARVERDRALRSLWNACSGILVIAEPGTPAGFARILEARTLLLSLGARIAAPCPGDYLCPIASPDWCHFSVRLPRSRTHMRAKSAKVPFEDEKFSYLAVARSTVSLARAAARILAEPRVSKPRVALKLCTDTGIEERLIPKRDKPAYKRIAKARWGDSL